MNSTAGSGRGDDPGDGETELSQVAPRKSLGQHFLHDERVLTKIAALSRPEPGSGIVEVGPGTGALTAFLVELGAPLHAVERDDRLPPLLRARFGEALTVHPGDATALDWDALLRAPGLGPRPVVVGNLPYNVGAAILMRVLELGARVDRMVVMLQREVAERICADGPRHPAWGLLAVHAQWRAETRLAFRVGPGAFRPPPKVDSAVITLQPRSAPPFAVPDADRFDRLVNAGFGQRRKQLVVALHNTLHLDRAVVQSALKGAGLPIDIRAERLDLAAWAALANALDEAIASTAVPAPRRRRDQQRAEP